MEIFALKVPKSQGEAVRSILYQHGLLDRTYHISDKGSYLEIPLTEVLPLSVITELKSFKTELITVEDPSIRYVPDIPFSYIEKKSKLPDSLLKSLPRRWELIGDVLIIKFPDELKKHRIELAEVYAKALGAKTVLQELSGISGITRKPDMELLFGTYTETVHVENKIKYMFDTKQLMFSSGNISERLRLAELNCKDETVVDMFAGIGYFSLPVALYTRPAKVIACELNPVSFKYLKENIKLNNVTECIEPLLGDCRETAPENAADRIIMGHIKPDESFISKALSILKKQGGIIHYHELCPKEDFPNKPFQKLCSAAENVGYKIDLLNKSKIKSFAPGIYHVVLDVKLFK